MELKQVIEQRRSIRKFKPDPIPDEYIREILEAARLAPSGTNIQPWRFVIVKSKDVREKIRPFTLNYVTQAPVVIICCSDHSSFNTTKTRFSELRELGAFVGTDIDSNTNAREFYSHFINKEMINSYLALNIAIAIEHMVLRAFDLGLGSCWDMVFQREEIKKILGLGENIFIVALLPIGFPAQNPKARPRLDLKELIINEF